MDDLTVTVGVDTTDSVERIKALEDALRDLSQAVDELEEQGITVSIDTE